MQLHGFDEGFDSMRKGLRSFLLVSCLVTSVGLAIIVVYASIKAWNIQTSYPSTCGFVGEPKGLKDYSYAQLDIRNQHPTEPYFTGGIFFNLGNTRGTNPLRLRVTRSGQRSYYQSTVFADLQYDEANHALWMKAPVDMDFIRQTGSHKYFPLDSAVFDFDLSVDPPVSLTDLRFRNYVPGFYMPCETIFASNVEAGTVHLKFELRRNPLVQLTTIVLVVSATIFLLAIIFFVKTESLPTSVASYFFSLWSIRAIVSSEIKTFPTLLDLAILLLCVVMLVLIAVRLALKGFKR